LTAPKKFKKYENERNLTHLDELHAVEVEEAVAKILS
jgi:hypothetical protein